MAALRTLFSDHSQGRDATRTMATERDLRQRIHRFFCNDVSVADRSRECPPYWVPPTNEQRNHRSIAVSSVANLHDDVSLVGTEEAKWLMAAHPQLDGRSPEDLLTGCDGDREMLGKVIAAIEQGAFT